MKVDYLIVGAGLAGIAFAQYCRLHQKSFFVISDASQNSSQIAGGLYNPVVLKRFSSVWQAQEQLDLAIPFYKQLELDLQCNLDNPLPLLRIFHSVEEQNNWFAAADKPSLAPFLATQLIHSPINFIQAPFGFGEVKHCGYLDTSVLVQQFKSYLASSGLYDSERFDYNKIQWEENHCTYTTIQSNHIIFAEGFGVHQNPFFNYLPLDGTKGELLLIKAPQLQLKQIIKSGVFVLPVGDDLYKVGATYNWEDKTDTKTQEARQELLADLDSFLDCEYEVIEHYAGVRPTVKDRRPLVGTHPDFPNLHVLNGLGTRGVMLGPAMAKALFEHIEKGTPLDPYIDIKRIKNVPSNPYRN
ncbi:MAG: tRNA 5-methylaminomethyl-2-thiouridine biosynthesis bifunctional protein MnmC [Bacteroidota bacterium]|jgi:glycine/D-amino acid oxidase-like deaminating enzyme